MKRRDFLIALGSTALAAGLARGAAPAPEPFLAGADISLLQKIEDLGGIYKEAGKPRDLLAILKDHGATCMRLRLFHTPDGKGPVCNDLPYTLKLARRIKAAGLRLILDIHYSDTWADPQHQITPKAWQGLAPVRLEEAVFAYTRETVAAMKAADALPEIVQVGNEITPGFLWNTGRVGGKFDSPEQWQRLGSLVRAGLRGIREAGGAGVRTMIHIDQGASANVTRWFFDHLAAEKVDFDLIGLSYYPWWHGTLDDLRSNLAATAARFRKDLVVVETGYPWTRERGGLFSGDPGRLKTPYPKRRRANETFSPNFSRRSAPPPTRAAAACCTGHPGGSPSRASTRPARTSRSLTSMGTHCRRSRRSRGEVCSVRRLFVLSPARSV